MELGNQHMLSTINSNAIVTEDTPPTVVDAHTAPTTADVNAYPNAPYTTSGASISTAPTDAGMITSNTQLDVQAPQKKITIPPPPQGEYPSEAEAEAAIHAWTRRHGFNVTKKQLARNDNGDTWWKYKEKIVKYWTDKHLHFGILDTSTVEGTHAKIKSWLESSKGDLLTVFNKLLPWWKSATNAVSLQAQRDARSVPFKLSDPTFSSVIKVITVHGLSETHSRWQLAIKMVHERIKLPEKQTQIQPCTGSYRRCYGLPCLHEMIRIYESNYYITLQPHDFDRHWFVRGTRVVQTDKVLEPARRTKKRRGASKLINSDIIASEAAPIHTQTFYELLVSDDHLQDSGGVDAFLPPRAWGFAGLQ